LFPEEILEEGKKQFAASNLEHEIKTYPGVPHGPSISSSYCRFTDRLSGFAVYGDYDSVTIKEAQQSAFQQILTWVQSH
jgi:hypothetical protein